MEILGFQIRIIRISGQQINICGSVLICIGLVDVWDAGGVVSLRERKFAFEEDLEMQRTADERGAQNRHAREWGAEKLNAGGWKACHLQDAQETKLAGTRYYHNHLLGETTWERPVILDEALLGNDPRDGGDYTNLTATSTVQLTANANALQSDVVAGHNAAAIPPWRYIHRHKKKASFE